MIGLYLSSMALSSGKISENEWLFYIYMAVRVVESGRPSLLRAHGRWRCD